MRPTTLVQLGARYLRCLYKPRFELVQNGNGLTVDAVQMERGHANGRLIFKRADEYGGTQEPFDVACDLVDRLGC